MVIATDGYSYWWFYWTFDICSTINVSHCYDIRELVKPIFIEDIIMGDTLPPVAFQCPHRWSSGGWPHLGIPGSKVRSPPVP